MYNEYPPQAWKHGSEHTALSMSTCNIVSALAKKKWYIINHIEVPWINYMSVKYILHVAGTKAIYRNMDAN